MQDIPIPQGPLQVPVCKAAKSKFRSTNASWLRWVINQFSALDHHADHFYEHKQSAYLQACLEQLILPPVHIIPIIVEASHDLRKRSRLGSLQGQSFPLNTLLPGLKML